jgi:hypothetical protein
MYNKIAFRAASIWYGIDSLESGCILPQKWSLMFWQNGGLPSKGYSLLRLPLFQHKVLSLRNPELGTCSAKSSKVLIWSK